MAIRNRAAGLVLAIGVTSVSIATAQAPLFDVLARHGIQVNVNGLEAAFEAHAAPSVAVTPGSFATPLAYLTGSAGSERIAGAYAFGILAGRSGRAASSPELAAAGQSLVSMMGAADRRSRIAGARVAGRVFAASYDRAVSRPVLPAGLLDLAFGLLNQPDEVEQLVAMDALGLLRESSAVGSLTERYRFYRQVGKRALAGGALEALARIGDPSTMAIVRELASDRWAEGKDATALAVVFARERMLQDGSIALIRLAADEKSRRDQARGYLAELGAPVP